MALSSPARQMPWTRHVASRMMLAMEDYRANVGQRLRELRESRNLSQEDAAHLVGVAVKTWHNWESGKRSPYEKNWARIAESFDVDIAPVRGKPPAPLGLDLTAETDADRLQALEERVSGLDEQLRLMRAELAARDAEALRRSDEVLRAIADLQGRLP